MNAPAIEPPVSTTSPDEPLLRLDEVTKTYRVPLPGRFITRHADLIAVDGVSLELRRGETFGLVGESGSGKSTLGRLAVRLERPSAGRIEFDGEDITNTSGEALRRRREAMQVVFQDPLGSLNPRMTVAEIVGEPIVVFRNLRGRELRQRVEEILTAVGLDASRSDALPRALSGGQRQRVGIARAIALNPKLVLADEAVSALDVSVQAQIVNLFVELRERLGLTYLFIAHGLPIVRQVATRVGVMYMGRLVEVGTRSEVFDEPTHPYTRALIGSAPVTDPAHRRDRVVLGGEPPSLLETITGCRFRTRCPMAEDVCVEHAPPAIDVGHGHVAECHFAGRR